MESCFNIFQRYRSIDEFEILNKIGEGRFGVVLRARHKKTHEVVAIKKFKKMKNLQDKFPLTPLQEINILNSLHHPSIICLKKFIQKENMEFLIVMEYIENNLDDFMECMDQPFSESEVKCLMFQLIDGVKYMHNNWIMHRDLKPSNILLNNYGELKICDFGLACQYEKMLVEYTYEVGSRWYRAPELLLGAAQYSTAIDMWSLGCIMGELLTKGPLFPGKSNIDQIYKIFKKLGTPNEKTWSDFVKLWGVEQIFIKQPVNRLRETFPATGSVAKPTLSEQGLDLLNHLLTCNPQNRISATDALNHEWFREVPLPKHKELMPKFSI